MVTQYFAAMSIDGFIAGPGNAMDWLVQLESSEVRDGRFRSFFSRIGAMAMGATTYEWALGHVYGTEPEKWRQHYGQIPCWVFTHRRLRAVGGANLVFARGDLRVAHKQMLAAADHKNLWLVGGGDLAGQFADHGLLDEILVEVAPVMLGGGAPLLPRRLLPPVLTLTAAGHDDQVAFLTYKVTHSPPSS